MSGQKKPGKNGFNIIKSITNIIFNLIVYLLCFIFGISMIGASFMPPSNYGAGFYFMFLIGISALYSIIASVTYGRKLDKLYKETLIKNPDIDTIVPAFTPNSIVVRVAPLRSFFYAVLIVKRKFCLKDYNMNKLILGNDYKNSISRLDKVLATFSILLALITTLALVAFVITSIIDKL